MIYFDVETCGFHGMAVLLQYAYDDGPIILHEIWRSPINETLKLIEDFVYHDEGVCGFNIAFDWFHLQKLYTVFSLYSDPTAYPEDVIQDIAILEEHGRFGPCVKPKTALDLMLHARKGPYQSTMKRKPIRIKKVPRCLAESLALELDARLKFNDIYFAKSKERAYGRRWKILDILDDDGKIVPHFCNLELKFSPSSALKTLAVDALKLPIDSVLKYNSVECEIKPKEYGYAPFCTAVGSPKDWKWSWPDVIKFHIDHWAHFELARKYASDDVDYLRRLRSHFGNPQPGDTDSILACLVASVRWRGYALDIPKIKELRDESQALIKTFRSPKKALAFLREVMDDAERLVAGVSTKKVHLENITKSWKADDGSEHPAAARAQMIIDARKAESEVKLYDKLLRAGRLHAFFEVTGARSNRMAGGGGLNAQGIKKTKRVRSAFLFADHGLVLCGGDFSSFEVTIAEAVYADPALRAKLQSGLKIHGIFGTHLYPGMTYEQIMATEGTADDKYTIAKSAVFAVIYMGEGYTIHKKFDIPIEIADAAYEGFINEHKEMARKRKEIFNRFCSMRQPKGRGTKVEWHEPDDCIVNLFGFPRYFTLENQICKALFHLAEDPPKDWLNMKVKVIRYDKEQFATNAVRSALFGCAFAVQGANLRAAGNHVIQSSGGELTKKLQVEVWKHQPAGIHPFIVAPMNGHDEILAPCSPELIQPIEQTVKSFIETNKAIIPFLGMSWKKNVTDWGALKS